MVRNYTREGLLRYRIWRGFRRLSCGSGINGLTVGITNQAGREFTVRSAYLVTEGLNYRFNPTGEVTTTFDGQYPKITRKQKRLLKQGKIDKIQINSEIAHRSWQTPPTQEGFVAIIPFTNQQFLLPANLVTAIDTKIIGLELTIEFTTWTGIIRIMKIRSFKMLDHVQSTLDSLRTQIDSGSFDHARKRFGLPPVRRMEKTSNAESNNSTNRPNKAEMATPRKPSD